MRTGIAVAACVNLALACLLVALAHVGSWSFRGDPRRTRGCRHGNSGPALRNGRASGVPMGVLRIVAAGFGVQAFRGFDLYGDMADREAFAQRVLDRLERVLRVAILMQ